MSIAGLTQGERRFPQTYAIRGMLGLIMLAILVALWTTNERPQPAEHPVLLWTSICLVILYGFVWVLIGKTVLTISEQGVRRDSSFESVEIPWSQIAETRYVLRPVRMWGHFGLVGALLASVSKSRAANMTLKLIGPDGKVIKITSNFREAREAAGIIFSKVLPPMVSAARTRIERGETIHFGPLDLCATTIQWKQQTPIPLGDLASAEIVGSNLRIKRTGKWMNVVRVGSDKIPDVLVFLELVESLTPQLKVAQSDLLVRARL